VLDSLRPLAKPALPDTALPSHALPFASPVSSDATCAGCSKSANP